MEKKKNKHYSIFEDEEKVEYARFEEEIVQGAVEEKRI